MTAMKWRILLLLSVCASGCRTPPPPPRAEDAELAKLARAATLAHRYASPDRAAPMFRAALARARALGDAAAAGRLAYNLAVCLAETGDLDAALALTREAQQDLRRSNSPLSEAALLEATLLFSIGDGSASEAADRARDLARAEGRRDLRAQAHALQTEIALARGDLETAAAELQQALRHAGHSPHPATAARIEAVSGHLATHRGDHKRAATAYRQEAAAWGRAGLARRVAEALERAAAASLSAGDAAAAAQAWLDAARSRAGSGDHPNALAALDRIARLPEDRADPLIRASAARLRQELESRRSSETPNAIPGATP